MNNEDFETLLAESRERRDEILFGKGMEYGNNESKTFNFEDTARALGLSPMQVWAVYFLKHIYAILTYVRTGRESAEGMEGRFDDAVNYLDLGWALIKDTRLSDERERVKGFLEKAKHV